MSDQRARQNAVSTLALLIGMLAIVVWAIGGFFPDSSSDGLNKVFSSVRFLLICGGVSALILSLALRLRGPGNRESDKNSLG